MIQSETEGLLAPDVLRQAIDIGQLGVWRWDLDSGTVTLTPLASELYGVDGAEPQPFDRWRRRLHGHDGLTLDIAQATADAPRLERVVQVVRADGRGRWLLERCCVTQWNGRTPVQVVGTVHDVTRQHEAESRRRDLIQELQHRIKNMLAVVRSLARRTAEGSESVAVFGAHFEGRLSALARAQTALARSQTGRIDLETLAWDELLDTLGSEARVTVDGPPVELNAKLAEPLALALHELAVNAMKFGAGAARDGAIELSWRRPADRSDEIELRWIETGSPTPEQPDEAGFGLDYLRSALTYETGGAADILFAPDGLQYRVRVRLHEAP